MMVSGQDKAVREKAFRILGYALDKKAAAPVVIDVRRISCICDYFIIVSGEAETHVHAIYDEIIRRSKAEHITVYHSERDPSSRWMLVDLFDVVVHIFLDDAREFYDLEHLWQEGMKVRLPENIFLPSRG